MLSSDISKQEGQEVTRNGWVDNFRSSGKIAFLQLRVGPEILQVIAEKESIGDQGWESLQKITIESSVSVVGKVAKHPKKDEYEIHASKIKIFQVAEEYPIGKKEHGPDFLLDHRHLWLRSRKQWAIQRVRNTIINSIYEFFNQRSFIKIDSPILTPNACEGTTTLFEADYFSDDKAYLSQSGQLYLEAAIASHGQVFDFGPVFRAEKSKTKRHLTEFWMIDAEMAFVEHEDNIKVQEELISLIIEKVLANHQEELKILERDPAPLEKIKAPFIRLTYDEVIKKLQEAGSDIKHGEDLGNDDEALLTKDSDVPIFIEKWPAAIKAFYMKRDPADEKLVLCDDLIATEGYGEIVGGSQREDSYEEVLKSIKKHELSEKDFAWYLDLRKYGSAPHSGFGLGLERMVAWMCGVKHVRETIPFPRMINRLRP